MNNVKKLNKDYNTTGQTGSGKRYTKLTPEQIAIINVFAIVRSTPFEDLARAFGVDKANVTYHARKFLKQINQSY